MLCLAYDHPEMGKVYMFVVHHAIIVPTLMVKLLSPMQLRDNGLQVNDELKFMVLNPTMSHHAVMILMEEDDPSGC